MLRTIPAVDMKIRNRICEHCAFTFTTEMSLPDCCPDCKASDSFDTVRTERTKHGIFRIYKCRECGKNEKAMETYPVLDENRKRPNLNY